MSKSNKVSNFYTNKEVQKLMPKVKDKQVEYTGMPLQKHILLCGSTGSGKSNTLMNYIARTSESGEPTFKHLMLVYKTFEPLYDFLQKKLGKHMTMYHGLTKLPPVSAFPDGSKENDKQILLVFDDCINDKDRASLKLIDDYYAYGRKKNITIMFLAQSFFDTHGFIRKQSSFVILNGISSQRDLRLIMKCYSMGNCTIEMMQAMYKHCKQKEDDDDLPFMKICTYECPMNKKFSKYFLDYLNPEDFREADSKKKKRTSDSSDDSSDDDSDNDSDSEAGYDKRQFVHPMILKLRQKSHGKG